MKKQKTPEIVLKEGNANILLDELDQMKFSLIISSPPYNIGKEYEKHKSIEDYLENQRVIIEKLVGLLRDNGSICWEVGNYIDPRTKEVFPLDVFYYRLFKELGLTLRNRIIWHFGHGMHAKYRFSGRYESILWFTKSNDDYIFNLDNVRIPSKYPNKKYYKGPKKGRISSNPKGKNPSDVWEVLKKDWEREIWNVPNVKARHAEKSIHPCQFPIELVERCILALTNEYDWVLDPYVGSGTTLIAAYKNYRHSVGIEIMNKYVQIAQDRIVKFKKGELGYRPLTKEIYSPEDKE